MRTVTEYLEKAVEFEALARRVDVPVSLKNRYSDLAECYRLLAKERERLVTEGVIPSTPLPNLPSA